MEKMLLSDFDGYVMVVMLYAFSNALVLFSVREHLRMSWWAAALLTVVEAIAIYQIHHYLWMGNICVSFLFFLIFRHFINVETYKLLYINLITAACATACNLMFYMRWGPSHMWSWPEMAWMAGVYLLTAVPVGFYLRRCFWPELSRLSFPAPRWLWVMPTFTIVINMLIACSHVQSLMDNYEEVYGITSLMVVLFSTGVCLLSLEIIKRNQIEASHKHDMELVNVQIAMQARRSSEVMQRMDEIRIMRHDLLHHIRMANMLLRNKDLEQLQSFLGNMECDPRLFDNIVYSHNHISDLVAHQSMLMARDANIVLAVHCGLPKSFWVSDSDLCVLLGNLMENAIHACRLQPDGVREIMATAKVQNSQAFICVENTCGDPQSDTPERREEAGLPPRGGYGMISVRNIAEKYGGVAVFDRSENRFKASILLFDPNAHDLPESEEAVTRAPQKSSYAGPT